MRKLGSQLREAAAAAVLVALGSGAARGACPQLFSFDERFEAPGYDRQYSEPNLAQFDNVLWPDVPTRFLLCRDDRFFPAAFQRRVVRERLGFEPDEMDGGHLPALSRPHELTQRLLRYLGEVDHTPQ